MMEPVRLPDLLELELSGATMLRGRYLLQHIDAPNCRSMVFGMRFLLHAWNSEDFIPLIPPLIPFLAGGTISITAGKDCTEIALMNSAEEDIIRYLSKPLHYSRKGDLWLCPKMERLKLRPIEGSPAHF